MKETKYPIGIQNFAKLRSEGFTYVDKTSYIYKLIQGSGYYFLSRPRRFGKSLLLSTIESYFKGERNLFKGLKLETLTDDWEPHPVFHIDLNNRDYRDAQSLVKELNAHLEEWEAQYGSEKSDRDVEERFAYIIKRACELSGKKVVILVDEYDKPLLNAIDNPELEECYRSTLKAFYSNLKSMDAYIEFAMLTGVARFSKVSIFSDLNNLRDISFDDEFAEICGISLDELHTYFNKGISNLADRQRKSIEQVVTDLKIKYDGYHFSPNAKDIFNPTSLLNTFARERYGSYWFETGTPTYLVRLVSKLSRPIEDLAPVEIESEVLETAGILSPDPIPAFYQSGYLSIKSYNEELQTYVLDYPNEEVKQGFLKYLMQAFIPDMISGSGFTIPDFVKSIREGDADSFMKRLSGLIASIPYSEKGNSEDHFQNAIYLLFTLLGFFVRTEQRTSSGRIDLFVEADQKIYIFEFKVNRSAEEAIAQILDKQYWYPYQYKGKEIVLIGASFNSETSRLTDWIIQRLHPSR